MDGSKYLPTEAEYEKRFSKETVV